MIPNERILQNNNVTFSCSLYQLSSKERMFKILVMTELFSSILCRVFTNASYVQNTSEIRQFYPIVSGTAVGHSKSSTDIQGKSYSGYGTALIPTYYLDIDPLNVLASLAFLAFLLHSVSSYFDRSRSTRSAPDAATHYMELKLLTITTQVLRALEKYEENSDQT